jgi:hypothetical protein
MTVRSGARILATGREWRLETGSETTVSTPIESPPPGVTEQPVAHVPGEGIREWFVREDWLLTDREVHSILTLRRGIAARYYNEWGVADPTE